MASEYKGLTYLISYTWSKERGYWLHRLVRRGGCGIQNPSTSTQE